MSEKTGFAARSFLMPCRHSGRSLASPVTKAKPNAVVLLWRGGTAEQVSFRIHPEANAAKLVPARSHFLRAAACPRRENRKQDVSCRPACTKKSRLPAALHAASIAHRSVPFHAILRRRSRSCGTSGTTGTAFFQKRLNTPVYRIYPVLYALIRHFLKSIVPLVPFVPLSEKALFFNGFKIRQNGTKGGTNGTTLIY